MCGSDIFPQDGSRKNISKRKKNIAASMDWIALWDVLKIYGVGGKLLSAVKSFYEDASACVKITGETNEHFQRKVGLRQQAGLYHVTMVAQYLYGWSYERNEGQSWGIRSKKLC